MREANRTADSRVVDGFDEYIKAIRKAEKEDEIRELYISKAAKHLDNFVTHVRKYIIPTLADEKPLTDFMNYLDNKGDVRVMHLRFINGLARIEAENLYSYDQSYDEREIIATKLMEVKKMIRNSHSNRKESPEDVAKMIAEYRVRRSADNPEYETTIQLRSPIFIISLIILLCLLLLKKR